MKVKRIGYLGVRTTEVAAMTSFFRDLLGLEAVQGGESASFQRLPGHATDMVEAFSPTFSDPRIIPDGEDFVVGFVVDDIREAMAEVQAAGLEVVSGPIWAAEAFDDPSAEGWAWFWLRAPDGRVYVFQQTPD